MGHSLDPSTSVFLFVFTVIIHAGTMYFLEDVSARFNQYVSATLGNGLVPAHTQPSLFEGQTVPNNAQFKPVYRPLHDTLDVSVFR